MARSLAPRLSLAAESRWPVEQCQLLLQSTQHHSYPCQANSSGSLLGEPPRDGAGNRASLPRLRRIKLSPGDTRRRGRHHFPQPPVTWPLPTHPLPKFWHLRPHLSPVRSSFGGADNCTAHIVVSPRTCENLTRWFCPVPSQADPGQRIEAPAAPGGRYRASRRGAHRRPRTHGGPTPDTRGAVPGYDRSAAACSLSRSMRAMMAAYMLSTFSCM